MRHVIAVLWLLIVLVGGSAVLTWMTTRAPIHLPLAFVVVLAFGFAGAAGIGRIMRGAGGEGRE